MERKKLSTTIPFQGCLQDKFFCYFFSSSKDPYSFMSNPKRYNTVERNKKQVQYNENCHFCFVLTKIKTLMVLDFIFFTVLKSTKFSSYQNIHHKVPILFCKSNIAPNTFSLFVRDNISNAINFLSCGGFGLDTYK